MGTWGVLAFDNDDANDWAYDLANVEDLSLVESALEEVEKAGKDVEAQAASHALAACEVLARLQGSDGYHNEYTAKVDQWVAAHPAKPAHSLLVRASGVIDKILADDSELRDQWSESDEIDEWIVAVEGLRNRLQAK